MINPVIVEFLLTLPSEGFGLSTNFQRIRYMKKLILVSLIIVQSCMAFAQNCCVNDTIVKEIQSPLNEQDTETDYNTTEQSPTSHDDIEGAKEFCNPDLPPQYLHGGDEGLWRDLYTAILETAPVTQDSVKGRAAVRFIISEEGQIDPATITVIRNRSVPDDYLNAAIEAIKKLGRFEPGKQLGTPKRVAYTVPVLYPVPLDKIPPVK